MKRWMMGFLAALLVLGSVPAQAQDAARQAVYDRAVQFVEQGEYERAISTFSMLGDYLDSAEQIAHCQELLGGVQAETQPAAPETTAAPQTQPAVPETTAAPQTQPAVPETTAAPEPAKPQIFGEPIPLAGQISASSYKDKESFGPEKLADLNAATAWAEGVDGLGEKESITWIFPQPVKIYGVALMPGYQLDETTYKAYSVPKELVLNLGGKQLLCGIKDYKPDFKDISKSIQYVAFPEAIETSYATVTIRSATAGRRYQDTCISEFFFFTYAETEAEAAAQKPQIVYDPPVIIPETTAAVPPTTVAPTTIAEQPTAPAASEFIFPDSDSRYIAESELYGLSDWELRIARNEIYARHGRKFASSDLNEYFNSKSWYHGTISGDDFDEDKVFNDYETKNRDTITIYERSRK